MYDHMLYVHVLMTAAQHAFDDKDYDLWLKHCHDAGFWLAGYQNLQTGLEQNKIVKIGDDYFYTD